MSMNREAYRLANEIKTLLHAEGDFLSECPGEEEMKHYKSEILKEVKKEKKKRTLYAQELSRGDDEGAQAYVQIGEPFEVELSPEP